MKKTINFNKNEGKLEMENPAQSFRECFKHCALAHIRITNLK